MKKPKEDEDQNLLFDIGDITRIIKILVKIKKGSFFMKADCIPS